MVRDRLGYALASHEPNEVGENLDCISVNLESLLVGLAKEGVILSYP
jgi:hypothetical protein